MSESIAPALTPDEWERERWPLARSRERVWLSRCVDCRPTRALVVEALPHADGGPFNACVTLPSQLAATIAVANHALPDDSPYKITREDVEAIRAIVSRFDGLVRTADGESLVYWDALYPRDPADVAIALAAKLAALLPPGR